MDKKTLTFYFDYVDPGSYLLNRLIDKLQVDLNLVILHPVENFFSPDSPIDPTSSDWMDYNAKIQEMAKRNDLDYQSPLSKLWTRKAHELRLHAEDKGLGQLIHKEIFKAHFQQHLDIGRIDVLVSIAKQAGLNPSESKATLDVDKYSETIEFLGLEATNKGIKTIPSLWTEAGGLEGPANIRELRKFLESSGIDVPTDTTSHPKS